jgi:hypothetical protein
VILWGALLFYSLHALDRESWRWMALSVLLVFFAPLCAAGPRGFERLRHGAAWVGLGMFLLVGLYLPWKLIWWVPKIDSLSGQSISAFARFAVAGLLFALMWLVLGGSLGVSDPEPTVSSGDPAAGQVA